MPRIKWIEIDGHRMQECPVCFALVFSASAQEHYAKAHPEWRVR